MDNPDRIFDGDELRGIENISVGDLILLYRFAKIVMRDGSSAAAAKALMKGDRRNLTKRLEALAPGLDPKRFFQGTPGRGTSLTPEGRALIEKIEAILRAYRDLVGPRLSVRVAAPEGLSIGLITEVLDDLRREDPKADLELSYLEPHELIREGVRGGQFDLVLAPCSERDRPDDPHRVRGETRLRRCLLCPNHHPVHNVIRRDGFSWRLLAGRTIAVPRDRAMLPDFPYEDLEQLSPPCVIRAVRTHEEAHVHVMSGVGSQDGCLSFTHPELLREHEDKYTHAIVCDDFGTTRLCLFQTGRRAGGDRDRIDRLADVIVDYLSNLGEKWGRARDLSETFSKYTCISHTSNVGSDTGTYSWFCGSLDRFRITPAGYVKGRHLPPEPLLPYEIFGRVLRPRGAGAENHLLWRATDGRDEHYSASFLFEDAALARGPIVGLWLGRRGAAHGSLEPARGTIILHQHDLGLEPLNACYRRINAPLGSAAEPQAIVAGR